MKNENVSLLYSFQRLCLISFFETPWMESMVMKVKGPAYCSPFKVLIEGGANVLWQEFFAQEIKTGKRDYGNNFMGPSNISVFCHPPCQFQKSPYNISIRNWQNLSLLNISRPKVIVLPWALPLEGNIWKLEIHHIPQETANSWVLLWTPFLFH